MTGSGARAPGRVPFSTLREQGSSKMFLTLGQAACVFQVLAKAAAVPSTTPLRARRSSAWFWLKFPQRPGPGVGVTRLSRPDLLLGPCATPPTLALWFLNHLQINWRGLHLYRA